MMSNAFNKRFPGMIPRRTVYLHFAPNCIGQVAVFSDMTGIADLPAAPTSDKAQHSGCRYAKACDARIATVLRTGCTTVLGANGRSSR